MTLLASATVMTIDRAGAYATMALANIAHEYPTKLDHFINGPQDLRSPSALHPVFFGSFDWHSCVHSHWMIARLLRKYPDAGFADHIAAHFDRRFTTSGIAAEVAYLKAENRASFVRTYGWAWLLKLAEELELGSRRGRWADSFGRWRDTLSALAAAFVDLYQRYLPKADVPLRYGLHPNSAFGLAFAIDFARTTAAKELDALCVERALMWFAADRDYPMQLEPSGNEFLSPSLVEADLMRRVLDRKIFPEWLERFLPGLAQADAAMLFNPVLTSDHRDPQMVHLDGLNLSRSWCLREIAHALGASDPRFSTLLRSADLHLDTGLRHVQSGNYMGEHWLATFAVMALNAPHHDR